MSVVLSRTLFFFLIAVNEKKSLYMQKIISFIMLIKLSIENFLSIKERIAVNFTATKSTQLLNHVVRKKRRNDFNILRAAAIFGPNASGKSNIVKAVSFAKKSL